MELPANPKNILYGVYNTKGVRVDDKQPSDKPLVPWQLYEVEDLYLEDSYDFGGLFE